MIIVFLSVCLLRNFQSTIDLCLTKNLYHNVIQIRYTVPTSESESESEIESEIESESVAHLGYVSSSLYPGCKTVSTRFKSYTFLAGLRAEIKQLLQYVNMSTFTSLKHFSK